MNNYVRLLLCGLACGPASTAWATPQPPDSVLRQERQKGRLWTVAVQQGWPALARQPQWPTKDSLDSWLNAQESQAQEIRSFRQQVISYVRDSLKQRPAQRPVSANAQPTELQQALERKLPLFLYKNHRPFTTAHRQALHQALQAALADGTAHISESNMTSTPATSPTADKQPSDPKAPTTGTPTYLIGLAGVVVGFAACWLTGKLRKNNVPPAPPIPATTTEPKAETEKQKLNRESLASVHKPVNRPQKPTPAIRSTATPPVSPPSPPNPEPLTPVTAPVKEAEGGLALGAEVALTVASSPKAAPLATVQLFGPSPDVPVIEARKFSAQSLPQMPICLKLASAEATTGSFELNPYAEQSRLIGNGIRELRTFFEFDLPLPESFTTLTTRQPGTLTLRDGSWHLDIKAKIELT